MIQVNAKNVLIKNNIINILLSVKRTIKPLTKY